MPDFAGGRVPCAAISRHPGDHPRAADVLHGPTPGRGTFPWGAAYQAVKNQGGLNMDGIIYLVGLIVIVMAILSFFGLR
jgi:hypothetical protein